MNDKYYDYLENLNLNERMFHENRLRFRYYKRKWLLTLYAVIIISLLCLGSYIFMKYYTKNDNTYLIIGGILSSVSAIAMLLLKYLQNDSRFVLQNNDRLNNHLYRELEELKLDFQKFRKKAGILDDDKNIDDIINKIINTTFTEEYIQNKIEKTFSENALKSSKLTTLFSEFERTSYRIHDELIRLRKSANINLVIGTLSTTLAIISLTYEVFIYEVKFNSTVSLLSHYIPRVSLVIFIEIFAFFFLRLYKANLNEIKYFNNEKTNIDFKLIALKTAIYQEDQEMIKLCLSELVKTERNFVLKKDESTVEIEKWKSEKENNQLLTNLIGNVLSKKN